MFTSPCRYGPGCDRPLCLFSHRKGQEHKNNAFRRPSPYQRDVKIRHVKKDTRTDLSGRNQERVFHDRPSAQERISSSYGNLNRGREFIGAHWNSVRSRDRYARKDNFTIGRSEREKTLERSKRDRRVCKGDVRPARSNLYPVDASKKSMLTNDKYEVYPKYEGGGYTKFCSWENDRTTETKIVSQKDHFQIDNAKQDISNELPFSNGAYPGDVKCGMVPNGIFINPHWQGPTPTNQFINYGNANNQMATLSSSQQASMVAEFLKSLRGCETL